MNSDEIDDVLDLVDKIAAMTGRTGVRALMSQFAERIPEDVRKIAMAQVTESIAERVRTGLNDTLSTLQQTTQDADVIEHGQNVILLAANGI